MKFASKAEFELATEKEWNQLWLLVDSRNEVAEVQLKLRQILAHLYAWHELLIIWYRTGQTQTPELPAPGFNWRQTRELNKLLDDKYKSLTMASVRRRLKLSHGRVMKIVSGLSEKQYSKPGQFAWTGKNGLSTYIGPNTFSHYRWACKKISKMPAKNGRST